MVQIAHHVTLAERARRDLDIEQQISASDRALTLITGRQDPAGPMTGQFLARATRCAVDGHLNRADLVAAEQRARRSNECLGRRSFLPRTRSKASLNVTAELEYVSALVHELGGQPDDAVHRYFGIFQRLATADASARSPRDLDLVRLGALEGVLSAAKRSGSDRALEFGRRALTYGEAIMTPLLDADLPDEVALTVANYRQWAGFFITENPASRNDPETARDHLTWALEHRPSFVRADVTRPMIEAELDLLRGRRGAAVRTFDRCRSVFDDVLPRHALSVRAMQQRRRLTA